MSLRNTLGTIIDRVREENVPISRVLRPCKYRGDEIERREVPCCGGKTRILRLFKCSHPKGPGEAWDIVCARCALDGVPCKFKGPVLEPGVYVCMLKRRSVKEEECKKCESRT